MDDNPDNTVTPGIAALPAGTTRQLSSGQVLVDPSSVVKELIDNALDARAKSIFVDISLNTIDSIQVKDNGHGIASEDRALACRRYCTSKIRDFHDLREVGGKWLGFRGEALASLAGMSQTLSVTTRVEGEPVAMKLKYGRDGELTSTERDSHPVGTTVKATHFLEHLPVRKQTAMKNSNKVLAKIWRLMQAYALARPSIRFRLHVLKANNNKNDFIYAPSANANVGDAALKVIGKTCALQCEWTATEADGYEIYAFLPKAQVDPSKISGLGSFVSVDSRPLASNRGTVKKIVAMFKEHLRGSCPTMSGAKEPFFCMNITCPLDSYDPNVEPAKDDVMFDNEGAVLNTIRKLFDVFYPRVTDETSAAEPPTSAQTSREHTEEDSIDTPAPSLPLQEVAQNARSIDVRSAPFSDPPRWRSSMYGMDEDDLEFLQEQQPPVIEEDPDIRDVAISNPWTIARMNAIRKPNTRAPTAQLLSPAKTIITDMARSSSPSPCQTPHRLQSNEPVTPQSDARDTSNVTGQRILTCLPIRGLPQPSLRRSSDVDIHAATMHSSSSHQDIDQNVAPQRTRKSPNKPYVSPMPSSRPRQTRESQRSHQDHMLDDADWGPNCTWFGQPMAGSQLKPPRRSNARQNAPPLFPTDANTSFGGQAPASDIQHRNELLTLVNNTDIRDFFSERSPARNALNGTQFADRVAGLTHQLPEQRLSNLRLCLPVVDTASNPRTGSRSPGRDLSSQERQDIEPKPSESSSIMVQSSPKLRSNAFDMQAHFAAYQARKNGFNSTLGLNPPSSTPHTALIEEPTCGRKDTTELRRRKSSRAPLEHVPRGYHTQNIIQALSLTTDSIHMESQKPDVEHDILAWGSSPTENYDTFTNTLSENRILAWVHRLDSMLDHHFQRPPDTNIHALLHEGIQRGLAGVRQALRPQGIPLSAVIPQSFDQQPVTRSDIVTPVPEADITAAQNKVGEWMDDFDMSQFVNLEGCDGDVQLSSSPGMAKAEDEFGREIEDDDMLMSA